MGNMDTKTLAIVGIVVIVIAIVGGYSLMNRGNGDESMPTGAIAADTEPEAEEDTTLDEIMDDLEGETEAESESTELVDCGDDQTCRQEKISTCSLAKGTTRKDYMAFSYEVQGGTQQSCDIYMKVDRVVYSVSDEISFDEIQFYQKFKDTELNCNIPVAKALTMHNGDLKQYCTGSYINTLNG